MTKEQKIANIIIESLQHEGFFKNLIKGDPIKSKEKIKQAINRHPILGSTAFNCAAKLVEKGKISEDQVDSKEIELFDKLVDFLFDEGQTVDSNFKFNRPISFTFNPSNETFTERVKGGNLDSV